MAHKVFICHSSKDKQIADAACAALEAQRIPCWIAPRDILAGDEYGKAIVEALTSCQIVLLIFSHDANDSPQVRREVERAVSKGKIIVPFRIEDVLPSDAMEYALSNTHWLDALTPPMEHYLLQLCDTISRLIQRNKDAETVLWKPEDTAAEAKKTPAEPIAEPSHEINQEAFQAPHPEPVPVPDAASHKPVPESQPTAQHVPQVVREPVPEAPTAPAAASTLPAIPPPKVAPSKKSKWVLGALGAVALLAIVAVSVHFSLKPPPPESLPPSATLLRTLDGHSGVVESVVFSPDGKTLASGSADKTVIFWDPNSGSQLRTLQGNSGFVNSVAYSPDGRTLAAGNEEKTISLWNVSSGQLLRTLQGQTDRDGEVEKGASFGSVGSVAFSPDGRTLASGSDDSAVGMWNVASGHLLHTWRDEDSLTVSSVAISPDGRTVAAGVDEDVKVLDLTSGSLLRTMKGHSFDVEAVAFSPDGRILASGSDDETVKLWDAGGGSLLRTLEGNAGSVYGIAFSPDGRTLASGSKGATVKLWDVASGKLLSTLRGHTDLVHSVAFSPDGRTLASASQDKTIKLWDVSAVNK
jgi:WD40 repeat protein